MRRSWDLGADGENSATLSLSYLAAEPIDDIPGGTGVGLGIDLLLRWHPTWRPSLVPYMDVGGEIQFAAGSSFPADGSRWMFTPHARAGWLIPMEHNRQASVTPRDLYVSNAGVVGKNSGYDLVRLILGVRWGRGDRDNST